MVEPPRMSMPGSITRGASSPVPRNLPCRGMFFLNAYFSINTIVKGTCYERPNKHSLRPLPPAGGGKNLRRRFFEVSPSKNHPLVSRGLHSSLEEATGG